MPGPADKMEIVTHKTEGGINADFYMCRHR